MSNKTPKTKFYKLGPKASLFVDVSSGLKISGDQAGKTSLKKSLLSKKISTAVANRHIIEIEEEEYNTIMGYSKTKEEKSNAEAVAKEQLKTKGNPSKAKGEKAKDDEELEDDDDGLEALNKKELLAKYAETVEDEDEPAEMVKAFKKLEQPTMVKQLRARLAEMAEGTDNDDEGDDDEDK